MIIDNGLTKPYNIRERSNPTTVRTSTFLYVNEYYNMISWARNEWKVLNPGHADITVKRYVCTVYNINHCYLILRDNFTEIH